MSAFSTWEKELHKVVFDSRYLLLSMKERKQCFEKFVRSRADEERKERKVKLKEKKDDFKKLMEEVITNQRYLSLLVYLRTLSYEEVWYSMILNLNTLRIIRRKAFFVEAFLPFLPSTRR